MTNHRFTLGLSGLLLVLAFLAVWFGGGFSADLGGDPDEPAHAVTSLLARDFVAETAWATPRRFAEDYYRDLPKVAIGHYPPVYYLVGGCALLIWQDPSCLLALQAALLALIGTLFFVSVRRIYGDWAASAGAVIIMALPLMWNLALHVMADLLLVALCLAAVLAWAAYCQRPSTARSLVFGLIAALAILTKGSGLMLGAIPPLVLLLRRDWQSLRRLSWWCAAAPVLLLAGPWMALTAGITKEGMTGQSVPAFFADATAYYVRSVPVQIGFVWILLIAVGMAHQVYKAVQRAIEPIEAAFIALVVGGAAVILIVPAGFSERYLAPLVPPLAFFALAGARICAGFMPRRLQALALPVAALIMLAPVARIPSKTVRGFSQASRYVVGSGQPPTKDIWLVSSDPRGEGGIIAHAAFLLPKRSPSRLRIHRASKDLGASDWMGRNYQLAFTTPADLLAHLDQLQVRWVFVDQSVPPRGRVPHQDLLARALASAPQQWVLDHRQAVVRQSGVTGDLLIYRSVARTGGP